MQINDAQIGAMINYSLGEIKQKTKVSDSIPNPVKKVIRDVKASCSCTNVNHLNDRINFTYEAPEIQQKTMEHPVWKGYLEIYKLITITYTDLTTEAIQIHAKIVP